MKGFSLVEIIIVVSLTVVISGMLVAILINNTELVYKETSRVSQGLDLNDALVNLKSYIRQAQSVAVSYPEGLNPTYTSSSTQLVLKFSSLDANGEIISNAYDFVIYLQDQDKLRALLIKDAASSRKQFNTILAKNVDQLTFDYLDAAGNSTSPQDAKKVRVSIRLKQKAGSRYETNIATGEANLRND